MAPPSEQMPLPFARVPPPARGFLPAASNAAARRWLDHIEDWPERRLVLWGPPGCGKTCLAGAWAGKIVARDGALPGPGGLPARIAIDDADRRDDETGLLHLLNAAAEAGRHVLLTAAAAPARWATRLPDLASRLRAIQAVAIEAPDDALLRALLAQALADRQLAVPQPVHEWLLSRLPRTAAAIHAAVERLDRVSLSRQTPITRPLAAAALGDLLDLDGDEKSPRQTALL